MDRSEVLPILANGERHFVCAPPNERGFRGRAHALGRPTTQNRTRRERGDAGSDRGALKHKPPLRPSVASSCLLKDMCRYPLQMSNTERGILGSLYRQSPRNGGMIPMAGAGAFLDDDPRLHVSHQGIPMVLHQRKVYDEFKALRSQISGKELTLKRCPTD